MLDLLGSSMMLLPRTLGHSAASRDELDGDGLQPVLLDVP